MYYVYVASDYDEPLVPTTAFEARVMRAAQQAAAEIERECHLLGTKRNGEIVLGLARDGRSIEKHYRRFLGELTFTDEIKYGD